MGNFYPLANRQSSTVGALGKARDSHDLGLVLRSMGYHFCEIYADLAILPRSFL